MIIFVTLLITKTIFIYLNHDKTTNKSDFRTAH